MTTPDQSKGDRSRDEVLAGEYVLGVLGADARLKVEARIRRDRQFAAIVHRWEENLSEFSDEYGVELPPPEAFSAIESRLFGEVPRGNRSGLDSLWNSLAVWRVLTLASVLAAVTVGTTELASWRQPAPGRLLIAEMAGKDEAVSLVARYDDQSGRLRVTPVATGDAQTKSLELWLIEGNDPARSLGILPQTGEGELIVPADMRGYLKQGVILAVSLEPFGGSPTGQATGPIVALGPAQ